jgi:2-keto-4-pentenoate hydratase/2-oxohepta-3-ene-1,7-dioic acid hydratase in catechol pathway
MRLCRFAPDKLGLCDGEAVRDVTAALDALPAFRYPLPRHDVLVANLDRVMQRVGAVSPGAPVMPLDAVTLLSPIANPGKIIGAPVNYQKHLEEVQADVNVHHNNPIATIQRAGLFLKATSSLIGAGQTIALRRDGRRTDHEIELAFVIGTEASNVSRDRALEYIAGYSIGLDITVRGPEERSLRKSVDTYTVLGPWLVTADEIPDPGALGLRLSVNGQLRQESNTRDLILSVPELVEFASSFYTLYPGDIIFTGTPQGVGPIEAGDVLAASIEQIGAMTVHVGA